MQMKTVGIIALVVVAVGLLFFSFKQSFLNGPAPAGQKEAQAMKASMEKAIAAQKEKDARGGGAPQATGGSPTAAPR